MRVAKGISLRAESIRSFRLCGGRTRVRKRYLRRLASHAQRQVSFGKICVQKGSLARREKTHDQHCRSCHLSEKLRCKSPMRTTHSRKAVYKIRSHQLSSGHGTRGMSEKVVVAHPRWNRNDEEEEESRPRHSGGEECDRTISRSGGTLERYR